MCFTKQKYKELNGATLEVKDWYWFIPSNTAFVVEFEDFSGFGEAEKISRTQVLGFLYRKRSNRESSKERRWVPETRTERCSTTSLLSSAASSFVLPVATAVEAPRKPVPVVVPPAPLSTSLVSFAAILHRILVLIDTPTNLVRLLFSYFFLDFGFRVCSVYWFSRFHRFKVLLMELPASSSYPPYLYCSWSLNFFGWNKF